MKLLRCSAGVWVWKCAVRLVPEDLTQTGVTAIPFEGSEMIVCAVCMYTRLRKLQENKRNSNKGSKEKPPPNPLQPQYR